MLVYSVTETVDIAYLLLSLWVQCTVHVVEFGHLPSDVIFTGKICFRLINRFFLVFLPANYERYGSVCSYVECCYAQFLVWLNAKLLVKLIIYIILCS